MNTLVIKQLLPELKKQVTLLADDLLKRVSADAKINDGLKEAFKQIEKGGRTAQAYEVWLEDYLDQVAVAWVLACVFVRFMEDNGLIDECWLAGEGERRRLAEDAHTLFFREHPRDSDREYFLHVFHEVGKIPAAADLFAEGKTPLWAVAPSGDAAMNLLKFWREMNPEAGTLKRSFNVASGDTRFLGDLYQELSEKAKKKYALLQTPVFVEEFILDRTLTPALVEFGLEKVRMIDPTCGSGHFLLGGFARLFKLWSRPEHTTGNAEKDAQRALDGVWGVDINPFAVAIARFRLIVAAVQACGIKRLKKAPGWSVHLATGDSLLFGKRFNADAPSQRLLRPVDESKADDSTAAEEFWAPDIYACEEKKAVQEILDQQYHAVVGNPPYITPKDRAISAEYRKRYKTAYDKYHLSTPFTERFFELSLPGTLKAVAGFVGMIKDNAFMKRDFGAKLIEEFFPAFDLTHVIDMTGMKLAGHGTPTVILFGRNRRPVESSIRAVLGIKGDPSSVTDAATGFVWRSILANLDTVGNADAFTSSADVPRSIFSKHPWSIGGGGASDLVEVLEANCPQRLGKLCDSIGITAFTLEDDAYIIPQVVATRHGILQSQLRRMVVGDALRDWINMECEAVVFPYNESYQPLDEDSTLPLFRYLWAYRTNLSNSKMFGGKTKIEAGLRWYEYGRLTHTKLVTPLSIAVAFVATHNHFVLDRGGSVFNRSAPIIKLPPEATEMAHIGLIGLLNSSLACFWMQQTLHNKGGPGGGSSKDEKWHDFYEFSATGLEEYPLPSERPLQIAQELTSLVPQLEGCRPTAVVKAATPTADCLQKAHNTANDIKHRMVYLQEELDWHCYLLYGVCRQDLQYHGDARPEVKPGERAFEIVMARQIASGALDTKWFEWLQIPMATVIPTHWPLAYRQVVEKRIVAIESDKQLALFETPNCKRRWESQCWDQQEQDALRNWLLDRLESPQYRKGTITSPELMTLAQMADIASADSEFLQVSAIYRGRTDFDIGALVAELVGDEAVPHLPILRYTESGLRKRAIWERTWALQRQQDAGTDVGEIPIPPKYTNSQKSRDFLKTEYWRLRGGLDVLKERWVSYPHCSTESDPTLVVGWAGWNHLQQATALVGYYDARKREGWTAERLKPLLAGLDQLIPWIHQWHPEVDPEYGETAGQSFQHMLESDAHELGLTLDDIRKWTPPVKQAKAAKQTKASQKKAKGQ